MACQHTAQIEQKENKEKKMELEYYLELFDKYECSEWLLSKVLGGMFAMILFLIIAITFCINFTYFFIDFIKNKNSEEDTLIEEGDSLNQDGK